MVANKMRLQLCQITAYFLLDSLLLDLGPVPVFMILMNLIDPQSYQYREYDTEHFQYHGGPFYVLYKFFNRLTLGRKTSITQLSENRLIAVPCILNSFPI